MKFEKSCGVIVYKPSGDGNGGAEILLICHRFGGHWAFPKGHVEANETEQETALRELKEETGVTAQILDGYREITTYSPGRGISKDVVFFVGKYTGGEPKPQPEEVRRVDFMPYDEALSRLTYAADKELLAKAKALIFANL